MIKYDEKVLEVGLSGGHAFRFLTSDSGGLISQLQQDTPSGIFSASDIDMQQYVNVIVNNIAYVYEIAPGKNVRKLEH
jgi:hypothetical protein